MSPTTTGTDLSPTTVDESTPALIERLKAAGESVLFGSAHMSAAYPEVDDIAQFSNTVDDPVLRLASATFRIWKNDFLVGDEEVRGREFSRLVDEVDRLVASGVPLDPSLSILLADQLSDAWMLRGNFELARQHGKTVHLLAKQRANRALERASLASLGFLTCMAGYVDAGIELASRATAATFELPTERFIGGEDDARAERHQAVDLADCYEFIHDWRRAAAVLRIVNSMINPGATEIKFQNLWALARCYSRLGEHEMAAELISQAALTTPDPGIAVEFKYARTLIVQDAARGHTAEALAACNELIEQVNQPSRVSLLKEIAGEAARIARSADEPHYCIEVLEPIDHLNGTVLPLLGVLAYRDLAWAYRRVGCRSAARHYYRHAQIGQARFFQRSDLDDLDVMRRPAALASAREIHKRTRIAQLGEQQSLYRGLGAVVHDVRTPLQSLALAFSIPGGDADALPIATIVESIDRTLDELLRDIEMQPAVALADIALAEVVDDVVATFGSAAERKSLRLNVQVDPDLWCEANVPVLARIVSNLVSNAIKFSPAHGVVHLSGSVIGADVVDLHVEDSGPGVRSDEVDQLFQWGGIGSAPATGGESQHGIGLFTANRLAKLLGATIRCHSKTATTRSVFSLRLRRSARLPTVAEASLRS